MRSPQDWSHFSSRSNEGSRQVMLKMGKMDNDGGIGWRIHLWVSKDPSGSKRIEWSVVHPRG